MDHMVTPGDKNTASKWDLIQVALLFVIIYRIIYGFEAIILDSARVSLEFYICSLFILLILSIIVWKIRPDRPELKVTRERIRDLVRRSIGPLIAIVLILFLGYGHRLLRISMTVKGYSYYYLLMNVLLIILLVGWVVFQERRLKQKHQHT